MKKFIQIMTICFLSFLFLTSINAQNTFPWAAGVNIGISPTIFFAPTTILDINPPALNNAYGIGGQTVLQNWGSQNIFTGVGAGGDCKSQPAGV